jgi:hypothetical protein
MTKKELAMTTRCKDGDIAIIINETPLCSGNLGRIVHVRGPYEYNEVLGLHCWVIKPVNNQKVWVQLRRDAFKAVLERIYWNNPRCLPDAWLLPLKRTKYPFLIDDEIEIRTPKQDSTPEEPRPYSTIHF